MIFIGVGGYGDRVIQAVHLDLQKAFEKVSYEVTEQGNSTCKDVSIFYLRSKSLTWRRENWGLVWVASEITSNPESTV